MLKLRLFGFPLQIHATFLILAVFVIDAGFGATGVALWMLAAFLSIIIHELGHAFTARLLGGTVDRVMIHGIGGTTFWSAPWMNQSLGRRFLVAGAGSALEVAVAMGVFALVKAGVFGEVSESVVESPFTVYLGDSLFLEHWSSFFLGTFIWISIVWGLLNWLPIGGLDGSHMLAVVLERFLPGRGRFHAAVIGLIVAIGAAWWFFQRGFRFAPINFILFAVQEFSAVRAQR
jgi:membrane-associated protease RseP (regulator of RpoE activity)